MLLQFDLTHIIRLFRVPTERNEFRCMVEGDCRKYDSMGRKVSTHPLEEHVACTMQFTICTTSRQLISERRVRRTY